MQDVRQVVSFLHGKQTTMIPLISLFAMITLTVYASIQCTRCDVAIGRRDRMALLDDYGSNRGWHWPWTPLVQIGFVSTIGCLIWAVLP